jgi:7-cyano-7-deazaguanine tRNA-ribosyltransferase
MGFFEIKAKDGLARVGLFTTKHGTVITPLLMPVVHPGKSAISPKQLKEQFGFQMVITNSYIINSHESFRRKALDKGVHALLDFEGPIMTDSGTFQMYFHNLPEDEIDPLEIIKFQKSIGSDIGTILDVFSDPKVGRKRVEQDTHLSIERARDSVSEKGEMLLAGTIQGGTYPDLREESAKIMGGMNFDVHPIGGVVPLMERYRFSDIVEATIAVKRHLPAGRPVHLFGCGHPMFFAQAVLLGCDFFDSASYAKFAEAGRMLLPTGTVHLKNLRELPCNCPVCSTSTAEDLQSLSDDEKTIELMKHNLYVSTAEMRRVRQAIIDGKLYELAAIRARSHPTLIEAFRAMIGHMDDITDVSPASNTSSILFTGWETLHHPAIIGFQKRINQQYPYRNTKNLILVPHLGDRPYSHTAMQISSFAKARNPSDVLLFFVTPMGPIPMEYEHIHPAQQCVFPNSLDSISLEIALNRLQTFLQNIFFKKLYWLSRETPTELFQEYAMSIGADRYTSIESLVNSISGYQENDQEWWERKFNALLSYQWDIYREDLVEREQLSATYSKTTGKIRFIKSNDKILFTLIPTTGLLAPTMDGAKVLLEYGIPEQYKVIMENEAAEYIAKGKSTLAKFVHSVNPTLKAGEEVLIFNEENQLVGVGRSVLTAREMKELDRGVAVSTRHSLE